MVSFIIRRVLQAFPTLLAVIIVIFFLLNIMPGDAALLKGSARTKSNPELVAKIRERWGLNDPLPIRFLRYASNLARGNFGYSIMRDEPVLDLLKERIVPTGKLVLLSIIIAMAVGLSFGFTAAVKTGGPLDTIVTAGAVMGKSLPNFWLGLMLMLLMGVKLGWLPTIGYGGGDLKHLLLPAISLGIPYAALIARTARGSVLDLIHEDYIRTARAKGLSEWVVRFKHIFANAIPPVITVIGLQFGTLLANTVVIEKVFVLPGIGTLLIDSIYARDIQVVQAVVLAIALSFIVINLLVDLSYGYVDPRIKYD
ncbi:MAG: ABC transporter permease [Desulfohalobiaceae bacterium]|nr:ABC transporter permease [Desulfohalobiaceae bacterium]